MSGTRENNSSVDFGTPNASSPSGSPTGPIFVSSASNSPFTYGARSSAINSFRNWPLEADIDPICERRLKLLETFEGDDEAGFEKPPQEAVSHVRLLLTRMYMHEPFLEAPAITPTADGEILVSWRSRDGSIILSFESEDDLFWSIRDKGKISGVASPTDPNTAAKLAQFVDGVIELSRPLRLSRAANVRILNR